MLLWFRSNDIIPCSEVFSTQKARTSFAFQMSTEVIAEKLGLSGIAAVSGNGYCFIPGGAVGRRLDGTVYYVGISTDKPEIDCDAAQAVVHSII